MNSDLKKEYVLRISQANNVQMIIISYEIIETYLEESERAADANSYKENIEMSKRCIEEMMNNLHYEYEISKSLKALYLYMKKRLRDALWDNDKEALTEVKKMIRELRESYEKIADQDSSVPLMHNAQSVMTGITYGRNQTLDELSQDIGNRGYRV